MKISVGLPVYDGKLTIQQADLLLAENTIAHMMGHQLIVRFLPSCTNLAWGRNQLVKEFMASDNDRLVFLDADVTFEPGSIVKIASMPVDFVGGAYRRKKAEIDYPVGWLPGDLWSDKNGLIEVAMVPTGFLSLSRRVFEKYIEVHPDRKYQVEDKVSHCFFQIPYKDGALYTEDAYFCREWREMGEKIYLDPELTLTHWDGNIPYVGNIGQWILKQNNMKEMERIA